VPFEPILPINILTTPLSTDNPDKLEVVTYTSVTHTELTAVYRES